MGEREIETDLKDIKGGNILIPVELDMIGGDTIIGEIDVLEYESAEEFIKKNTDQYIEITIEKEVITVIKKYIKFLKIFKKKNDNGITS